MKKVTRNKDGSIRKKGSGRTKGSVCFTYISLREIKKYITEDMKIPVSRVWLEQLTNQNNVK